MNDDELKRLWRQQPLRDPVASPAHVISAMQNKMTGFRRTLGWRDLRELSGCAIVIVVFGIFYFTVYRTPLSRLGDLIVIGGALFVAWKIVYTSRTTRPAPADATVVESLRAELNSVRTQSRLLGSVLWWYLLPGFIGVVLATWGLEIDIYSKIACTLFFIAVDGFIYWLNQWARSKQLVPLEAQLESLLRSAETGAPLDETQVANLRPIVLSMAAMDKVKPVEFKVAFWQMAIYGVSGIVGIWFFWTLSRAIDNGRALIPGTFAPAVDVDTNRYSVVARKLVDLLNAADYSAVEKLYNPEMSKAFPSKKTSDFYSRLAKDYGMIEKFDGPYGKPNPWVAFGLHCQRGELTMTLALDARDQVAGIYFKPALRASANFKSIAVQFLSWRSLLWFVVSFLGGLLYSWLMQKLTVRAVGISALGVHLYRGQHLVLWDEINEVRPLRVLNIRSLWLIRESGEKMIMPWTSLERHGDVKAAVEVSAPANHPLRNYVSLLRRI